MDIRNMIHASDNHILLSPRCLWKAKSDLSKMSKFKIFSQDLLQPWNLKIAFKWSNALFYDKSKLNNSGSLMNTNV